MELADYLRELKAAGRPEDSGFFTLSLESLLEKVARFGGAEVGSHLLHAVQAAVALEALMVDIKVGRAHTEVCFEPGQTPRFDPHDLLSEPSDPQPGQEQLKDTWMRAMAEQPASLELEWRSPHQWWTWSLVSGVVPRTPRPDQPPRFRLSAAAGGSAWNIFRHLRQRSQTLARLESRCAFCPIVVKVDRRAINQPFPERVPGWLESARSWRAPAFREHRWAVEELELAPEQGFALASYRERPPLRVEHQGTIYPRQVYPEPGTFDHPGPTAVSRLVAGSTSAREGELWLGETQGRPTTLTGLAHFEGRYLTSEFPPLRVRRWLALPNRMTDEGYLLYVKDGILLDPVKVPQNSSRAIVWTSGHRVDLSRLAAVRDHKVEADTVWMRQCEKRLQLELPRLLPRWANNGGYQPDLRRVWNRKGGLEFSPVRLILGRASEVFELPERFDEPVHLQACFEQETLELVCGEQNAQARIPVARMSEFTGVRVDFCRYLHERDWPAEDEEAIQIRVLLTRGSDRLEHSLGGYEKFVKSYHFESKLEAWATRLAECAKVQVSFRRPTSKDW
ncbi:MAG: hypothetical protein AB7S38_11475 [Vulcanimicrobiota bacterium]